MTREEAIEKVRKWNLPKETREILEALAPELKENEDERVRKDILRFLKAKLENCTAPTPAKSTLSMWIDYLEKQKPLSTEETELNSIAFLEQMGYTFIPPGVKPVECKDCAMFLNDKCERPGGKCEKKNQKLSWSEEDERNRNRALFYTRHYQRNSGVTDGSKECVDWLKALSLNRKKTNEDVAKLCSNEWSEEDEHRREGVVEWLRDHQKTIDRNSNNQAYESIESLITWFQSLRPSWKPSEQEKGALRTAIYILTDERSFPKAAAQLQNILDAFE